jgi:hypothetical protein
VKTSIITKGVRDADYFAFRILAVGNRSADQVLCPTLDFLREQNEIKPSEVSNLAALLERTAFQGPPKNDEKFKKVEGSDGIFEFKSYQLRLYCFFDEGSVIICTNGAVKKRDRANPNNIEKAEEWKSRYFTAKSNNTLIHLHGH